MLRCFKSRRQKKFLDNGSALLEELITTFNGRQEIPIRSYTAKEIINATNNFVDYVGFTDSGTMYRGSINERRVLVKKTDHFLLPENGYIEEMFEGALLWTIPSNEIIRLIIRDIAITSQMNQLNNVLKLSGCCLEFKYPVLVYEFVEFETLRNLLHDDGKLLPWKNRVKIALDISSAVLYLHTSFQTPIIHRDLNPSNVIIDPHGVAKLFNFSFSISLPRGESQVEDEIRGAFGFTDPEYNESGFVTQKSDVYSFGVILLELVTGQKFLCVEREPPTLVDYVMEKNQSSQIIDPKIVKEGFDHQQMRAILDLGMRCTQRRGEDRPEMIDVARELREIHKSVNI